MNAVAERPGLAGQERPGPLSPNPGASPSDECLAFQIGDEQFAIHLLQVREIRTWERPTRLANAAPQLIGVIDLRGLVVALIDLRVVLGRPPGADASNCVTIVVSVGARVVGLVVDAVSGVVPLAAGDVRPAPAMPSTLRSDALTGLVAIPGEGGSRLLQLLDLERLLATSL